MGDLITSKKTYSTEDGIWLLFLVSMEKGVLLMVDEDVPNMETGIDGFTLSTDGTGDRGANPSNSMASSSAMSGMTWTAELRTMGSAFSVLPLPYL